MKLDSATLLPQITTLLNEYYKYYRYAAGIKRDFVFNTFFEKLINLLGWDPWNKNDYIPFSIEIGHEMYYGARLFLPNKESMVALLLDEDQIISPKELDEKKVNMSFSIRMALLAVYEKIKDSNIKIIWISSISKNYFYYYPDEIPIHYFTCDIASLEAVQRSMIINQLFPSLRLKNVMEIGSNVAAWLKKWESRLIQKGGMTPAKARTLLDLLMCVAMICRSNLTGTEPALLDNLVLKYYLSKKREFFLDIDFSQVLPAVVENFKRVFAFNFYNGISVGEIKRLPDELLVELIEELVCLAKATYSLECLSAAYHILEDENFSLEWNMKRPLLTAEVEIKNRSLEQLMNLKIHVDGENVGLLLGTYDKLEKMYDVVCSDHPQFSAAGDYHNDLDLLRHNMSKTTEPLVTFNYIAHILEKNIVLIHVSFKKQRTLNVLLIKKVIISYERLGFSDIKFPFIAHFATPR